MIESILLAVPTRGSIHWTTATRLQELRDQNPGLSPVLYHAGHLSVALTRNEIVEKFIAGSWQILCMVDDDVVPPPHFLDLHEKLAGFGMVGIPYPMFYKQSLEFVIFDEDGENLKLIAPEEGLHECDAIGTGCVMITREAVETLGPAPFRMGHDPSAKRISDDFIFCNDLKTAGYKVGYWWDGWYADHVTTVSLAPIKESMMKGVSYV